MLNKLMRNKKGVIPMAMIYIVIAVLLLIFVPTSLWVRLFGIILVVAGAIVAINTKGKAMPVILLLIIGGVVLLFGSTILQFFGLNTLM